MIYLKISWKLSSLTAQSLIDLQPSTMTKKALLTLESPMSANFTLGLSCSKLGILKMTSMISSASSEQEEEQEHQSDLEILKYLEISRGLS